MSDFHYQDSEGRYMSSWNSFLCQLKLLCIWYWGHRSCLSFPDTTQLFKYLKKIFESYLGEIIAFSCLFYVTEISLSFLLADRYLQGLQRISWLLYKSRCNRSKMTILLQQMSTHLIVSVRRRRRTIWYYKDKVFIFITLAY